MPFCEMKLRGYLVELGLGYELGELIWERIGVRLYGELSQNLAFNHLQYEVMDTTICTSPVLYLPQ